MNRHSRPRLIVLAVLAVIMAAACGASATRTSPPPANPLVTYLRGAELQCEEAQEPNIRQALADLATLPTPELRVRRYADYRGTPNTWDLARVLRSHFVPDDQRHAGIVDDPAAFWAAADSDDVRSLAREMLQALERPARTSPVLAP